MWHKSFCNVLQWYCNFPWVLMWKLNCWDNTNSIICQNATYFLCLSVSPLSLSDLLWPLFSSVCLSFCLCLSALQLTLTPAQQQMLIQQAQAQILAAAVQHSASQQNSTTGASISASAATPITQLPLSQPIQIAPVRHNHPCTSVSAAEVDWLI